MWKVSVLYNFPSFSEVCQHFGGKDVKFNPKNAILTNLSPVLDYKALKKLLPKNVVPAHDGLSIKL